MITARTDVVGSMLRPPELLQAQKEREAGRISQVELKAVEDRAVDRAVTLQENAGLDVVTDGEMRRLSFQSQLTEAVDGFGEYDINAFLWGDWHGDAEVGDQYTDRPATLGVVDKLKRKRHLCAEEFSYLRCRATSTAKITLPSPSMMASFWSKEHSTGAYPTLDSFLADLVDILRDEVVELARLGCEYIQLDAPHYPLLIDPKTRAFYEQQGWDLDRWLARGIELDNALMTGFPEVTFGFHLCRGNQGSRWLVEGGYDLIAQPIFKHIAAQRLLLEYDDERSGGFEPLAGVPDDKIVVLGLVTTKSNRAETVKDLSARIMDASRYIPLEQLALSPQCGFATSILGNNISPDSQQQKLKVIAETARQVWG